MVTGMMSARAGRGRGEFQSTACMASSGSSSPLWTFAHAFASKYCLACRRVCEGGVAVVVDVGGDVDGSRSWWVNERKRQQG